MSKQMKPKPTATKGRRKAWAYGPRRKSATAKKTPPASSVPEPQAKPAPISLAGLSPRERLDSIHAHQALLDLRVRQGELVERSEVEAGHAEARELIRNDLIGTLPLRLAGELSGRVFDPAGVRTVVLAAVREIIRGWSKAGIPAEAEQ